MVKKFLLRNSNVFLALAILGILLAIYRFLFLFPITSAGDLPYYWDTYINEFTIPYIWNPHWPTGLGGNQAVVLPLKLYFHLPIIIFVHYLHIPWEVIERVVFFFVFFALSIYSSYLLTKSWLGSLIYAGNTWILMVISGGQMGIALSYAIAPLVLWQFIRLINTVHMQVYRGSRLLHSILAGVIFSLQIMFDVRIGYILAFAVFVYFLLSLLSFRNKQKNHRVIPLLLYALLIPASITVLLNAYWILPLVFSGTSLSAVNIQPTLEQVKFFSFATFPNAIGLLHPNWPENIFGKVSFMKAEFLLLPIIAYASLLFVSKRTKNIQQALIERRQIIFFALISLVGAFMAKGSNEPFGEIYLWLFEHTLGFNMFRDSTKFYVLIALGYSFLIPFSLRNFSIAIRNWKIKKNSTIQSLRTYSTSLLTAGFIAYFVMLLIPAFTGEITGIFKEKPIPNEYVQLKNYLEKERNFSRTLWIPQQQRFGLYSNNHPALSGADIFPKKFPESLVQLQAMSVQYVIVPYDSESEIFLKDRRYDEKLYNKTIQKLRDVSWIKEEKHFGKIILFEVANPQDHLWIDHAKSANGSTLTYKRVNDTKYEITVKNIKSGDRIIFSEQYDPGWVLRYDEKEVISSPYRKVLNSYTVPENISSVVIEYKPQKMLMLGWIISSLTLAAIGLLSFAVWTRKK